MAKIAFGKLDLKKVTDVTEMKYNDEIIIEVKKYLPIQEKLNLVSEIVNLGLGDKNFIDHGKIDVFTALGIIKNYTNITFTDKQMEEPAKIYDLFVGNEVYADIIREIPRGEIEYIMSLVELTAKGIMDYRNSAVGIVEAISQDYNNLNFDASEIQKKLGDPENMAFLKDVLTKLG